MPTQCRVIVTNARNSVSVSSVNIVDRVDKCFNFYIIPNKFVLRHCGHSHLNLIHYKTLYKDGSRFGKNLHLILTH